MTGRLKLAVGAVAAACLVAVPVGLAASDSGPFADGARTAAVGGQRRHRSRAHVHRAPVGVRAPASAGPPRATVAVGAPVRAIPRSFLGLSIEYWGMPLFEAHLHALGRVLSLLHVAGDGPLVVRVGGDSADRSWWDPAARRVPGWVFRLSPRWLTLTRRLLARVPLRLILDLNLVTASPVSAGAWAAAAAAGLPRGSIAAFEIGNEPDIYDRPYWLATIARTGAVLPAAISARSYLADFADYARALRRLAPGVPLMGPAVATPTRSLEWIKLLARYGRPALGALTAHRYPYSACVGPGSLASPTIARLLSDHGSAGAARSMLPAVQVAHHSGLPLRVTELNSVTCGGRAGVSDTFATALWAPDALFSLIRAGVDGVNIHVRADAVNAAFVPARAGMRARPLLYGLIAFVDTLAPGGELLSTAVREPAGAVVRAWTVRTRRGALRLLLLNKGSRGVEAVLPPGLGSAASVRRLLASSPRARGGETFAGRRLARSGAWRGTETVERLRLGPGGPAVWLPAASAALVQNG